MRRRCFLIAIVFFLAISRGTAADSWAGYSWSPNQPGLWHVEGAEYVLRVPYSSYVPGWGIPIFLATMQGAPTVSDYEVNVELKRIGGTTWRAGRVLWRNHVLCLMSLPNPYSDAWAEDNGNCIIDWTHLFPGANPPGQWNQVSIRSQGRQNEIRVNGVLIYTLVEEQATTGTVKLGDADADPYECHFRNFSFRPLAKPTAARNWTLYE